MFFAYEPLPLLAKKLSERFPASRVTIRDVALSDQKGEVKLFTPVYADNGEEEMLDGWSSIEKDFTEERKTHPEIFRDVITHVVKARRLDDENISKIGFIKIDVEGAELQVLHGARQTLEKDRPTLLIEIEERHRIHSLRDVCQYLGALGYRGYYIQENALHAVETFDISTMQAMVPLTRVRERGYTHINNFIFLPEECTDLVDHIRSRLQTK